jgi:uncharacterized membrane protein
MPNLRTSFLLLTFLLASFFIPTDSHSEEISSFVSDLYIHNDGTVQVRENIEYDFGNALRHGIYRDIPYKYSSGLTKYSVRLDVEDVTNFSSEPYNYKADQSGGWANIRIGDPDREITGQHNYRIEYSVKGAIGFFEDHDELYWNVTGDEWRVPIISSGANVHFDEDIADGVIASCYTGPYGSTEKNCSFNIGNSGVSFKSTQSLNGGEGLTIVVGIPKGIIEKPSQLSKFLWFIYDNWAFALPFVVFFGMLYIWKTRGKDPEGKGVIAVSYEPPEDLSPAEAGTLFDERVNILDITSTVIDLAVRGFLEIEEQEATSFFFFTNTDYKLVRTEKSDVQLKSYEKQVLTGIFTGKESVKVSELRNKFYTRIPGIKKALYKELIDKRYFPANPENVRNIYKWIGIGSMILGFFLMGMFPLGFCILLSGLIIIIYSRYMPKKTKTGTLKNEELLGFREFIDRAEKDRIEKLAKDDPTLFDRVLPYALVFGLEDKWAGAFKDMYKEPPDWYHSSNYGSAFTPNIFVNDIGRSLGVMSRSLSSTPRRSGGSGFSSGGGFSGGGSGGGGGGSW